VAPVARGRTGEPNPSFPSAWLAQLLPAGVATAELAGSTDPALLHPDERRMIDGAAPGRISGFTAGRLCARHAVARFCFWDIPIGAQADRRPLWPDSLTGSITHTGGFAAAAVGERRRFRAIGIDAERVGTVPRAVWGCLFRPAETAWLAGLPPLAQDWVVALMFSAKEAFYKCQYEVTGQWLEFRDVVLDFCARNAGRNGLAVRPAGCVELFQGGGGPAIVRFAFRQDLVLTAMALAAH
jgi:4'-phosphopantetheinyl transferase EntD